ncbi:MAG TPA: Hsp20/alpha crystallin family protein [Acidimicrobiales bacterium]|nr:Hsp20/alpha crystallin family protein [Acidimicrobiales bacterium]
MALPVRRHDDSESGRWEPLAELSRLNQQLQRYVDNWRDLPSLFGEGFAPLADVEETDDAFVVEIDLAGVKKDDVDIELSGRRLVVSGERKERERVGILRKRTRTVGRFRYEVVLPAELEEEGVSAALDEGVLSIRVPKAASERPRRITVQ